MAKTPDYYAILGVSPNASQEEIKQAYLEAAQRFHPDKNKVIGETEIFLEIQQAYETLYDLDRRKKYHSDFSPSEKPSLPVQHKIYYSRPNLIRSEEAQLLYVLLEVSAHENPTELPVPPLNVCLVLDRSTSMKGEKMEMVKSAAIEVLKSLRGQDIFSLVSFSDRAEVVIPASTRFDKQQLESYVHMLQPSGATEIFQGLQAGFKEIKRNAGREHIDHIILLTDGHTYGDEAKCNRLAETAAKQRIGISAMGISEEWNDQFLDSLAKHTGGSSRYIARTKDIQNFLLEKFDKLGRTLVDDVVLIHTPNPGIDIAYAFRTRPETGPLSIGDTIHLGPVLKDTPLSVLFECKIEPSVTKHDMVQILTGSLKLTIAALPTPKQPIEIEFSREVKVQSEIIPPPATIHQALSKLTLYRMQEKAHKELDQGQYELAAKTMQRLATNLLALGEKDLAQTVMIEAKNIENTQAITDMGSKKIKYGTRALVGPEKQETRYD